MHTSTLSGHAKGVNDFCFSSDNRFIVSCSDNNLIVMWDTEKAKPIQLFPTPKSLQLKSISTIDTKDNNNNSNMHSALFYYDVFIQNQIVNGSLRSNSTNSNDSSSTNVPQTECKDDNSNNNHLHRHYILCLALNASGNIMASGSFDETVILWDVRSAKPIKVLSAHSDPVCCLSFCRDGTMLLSAGYDGLIRGWDMSNMRCIKTLGYDPTAISFAKWTPNGQYIVSGTMNDTIRIWDFQTAKTVKTYKGHKNEKFCLFSDYVKIEKRNMRDLECIVCGSEDGFVFFWDVQTKEIVYKLKAHHDVVIATDFRQSNDDNFVLFASGGLQRDNTVKIWQVI